MTRFFLDNSFFQESIFVWKELVTILIHKPCAFLGGRVLQRDNLNEFSIPFSIFLLVFMYLFCSTVFVKHSQHSILVNQWRDLTPHLLNNLCFSKWEEKNNDNKTKMQNSLYIVTVKKYFKPFLLSASLWKKKTFINMSFSPLWF